MNAEDHLVGVMIELAISFLSIQARNAVYNIYWHKIVVH